jgi:hypothetical protein
VVVSALRIVARDGHLILTAPDSMPALLQAMRTVSAEMDMVTSQSESDALVTRSYAIAIAVAAELRRREGLR